MKCSPCTDGWHTNCQGRCDCECWRMAFAHAIYLALNTPPRPDQLQRNP